MVEVSVAIRRERREQETRDDRFLASLYRGYPDLIPADLMSVMEKERQANARKWFERQRLLRRARKVVFRKADTISRSIVNSVAEAFEMAPDDLVSDGRSEQHIRARSVAIRLLSDQTWSDGSQRFSKPQIGRIFGRDRTTIGYALENFESRMKRDDDAHAVYEQLRWQMEASA